MNSPPNLIEVHTAALDDHGAAIVRLNRPERKNAMSHTMREDLAYAFEALTVDPRVVILTGQPRRRLVRRARALRTRPAGRRDLGAGPNSGTCL